MSYYKSQNHTTHLRQNNILGAQLQKLPHGFFWSQRRRFLVGPPEASDHILFWEEGPCEGREALGNPVIVQSPRGPISGFKRAAQLLPPQAGE